MDFMDYSSNRSGSNPPGGVRYAPGLIPDLIAVCYDGNWLFVNEMGMRLLGVASLEALIGKPVASYFPDFPTGAIENGEIFSSYLLRADGSRVNVEVTITPILYDGRSALQLIAMDNSRPGPVAHQFDSNIEGWSDLESFILHAADAITIQDLNRHILKTNRSFERLYGWNQQEVIGRCPPMVPEYLLAESEALLQITRKGVHIPAYETIRIRKDGTQIYVSMTVSPLVNANGVVFAFATITRDITHNKKLEQDLQRSIAELKRTQNILREREKLSIIGTMAAGMAHEIRNPLTSIRGFVQLIGDRYKDDVVVSGYVQVILDETKRANQVIVDFLQLARPRPACMESVRMIELAADVATLAGSHANLKNVRFEMKAGVHDPTCVVDQSQIKQVLLNLCQNAIEATGDGGSVSIGVDYAPERGEVYVEVTDTGTGIPSEQLGHIGVPFYSTKDGGTGLGLSISYAIVQAHMGRIEIESKMGQGATFRVCLPTEWKWREMDRGIETPME